MSVALEARNANLGDVVEILKDQQRAKLDIVGPMVGLRSDDGLISVAGTSALEEAGAQFRPTVIADGQIAERLGIPTAYLRRMRDERVDLYDANVNGWIHGSLGYGAEHEPDARTIMARCFIGDVGSPGVLRAVLSDGRRGSEG
jgi:hypothetical protein